jgi:ATP-dependent Clp protease protease subunit
MIKAPVYTIALGKCYSAAPLLVAGGEPGHRYSGPNTNFMVHQSWDDFGVKRSDEMEKYSEAMKKAADRWYKLMEKLTKKPYSFWKQKVEEVGDTYFSANQAKTWGVIDHIWDEKAN